MPTKESFDIDGLMVFKGNYTSRDQDGNIVAGVITPDLYKPKEREPLSSEQIGRYTNTTDYWRTQSTFIPKKGDVIIYSDGGSITEGGVTVYVPKIKVGDGVTTVGNLPFTDSDNQGGGTEEVFVCTFTGSSTITCDKTVAQIYDAWYSNKEVIGIFSTSYYRLSYINNVGTAIFFSIRSYGGVNIDKIQSTDGGTTWTNSSVTIQEKLVSGTNIKTINGNSLLGNGNLTIGGVTIYSGHSAPSSETGSNGDIYIQEVV